MTTNDIIQRIEDGKARGWDDKTIVEGIRADLVVEDKLKMIPC